MLIVNMTCGKMSCCLLVYFFFQAEDGIRDLTVTGVQTCALPIFGGLEPLQEGHQVWLLAPAFHGNLVRDIATCKSFGLHLKINLSVNVRCVQRDRKSVV